MWLSIISVVVFVAILIGVLFIFSNKVLGCIYSKYIQIKKDKNYRSTTAYKNKYYKYQKRITENYKSSNNSELLKKKKEIECTLYENEQECNSNYAAASVMLAFVSIILVFITSNSDYKNIIETNSNNIVICVCIVLIFAISINVYQKKVCYLCNLALKCIDEIIKERKKKKCDNNLRNLQVKMKRKK